MVCRPRPAVVEYASRRPGPTAMAVAKPGPGSTRRGAPGAGAPSAPGLAPPSLENHLTSASVTVPPDATVVIGGLTLESVQNTIIKVPLLGDIPLLGQMFRDTNKSKQRATLYVFITPTIMRDPSFADLRLLTKGPMAAVRLDPEDQVPPPEPVKARILEPAPFRIETGAGNGVKP